MRYVSSFWSMDSASPAGSPLVKLDNVLSDDELRNLNSHEYLLYVARTSASFFKDLINFKSIQYLQVFLDEHAVYDSKKTYGNFYEAFFRLLEQEVDQLPSGEAKTTLLTAIFYNDNQALERAADISYKKMPHQKIVRYLAASAEANPPVNQNTPQSADTTWNKASTMGFPVLANYFGRDNLLVSTVRAAGWYADYKPMFLTSQVSVRRYTYSRDNACAEIRTGTQAQYHEGTARLNPLFSAWLEACSGQSVVYFNNLGWDGDTSERLFEKNMTQVLHEAENNHPNLWVITLPADLGLMRHHAYLQRKEEESASAAFQKILDVVMERSALPIRDFKMSKKVASRLYGDATVKEETMRQLLKESFMEMTGIDDAFQSEIQISQAQFQAVYVHFIKYKLTRFILEALSPQYFMMACKDGIDRAGVSSAYFNLMKSISLGRPLSEEEFHRALHGASTLVKGRGMNGHHDIIWNALFFYVEHNIPVSFGALTWLRTWVYENKPKEFKDVIVSSPDSPSSRVIVL